MRLAPFAFALALAVFGIPAAAQAPDPAAVLDTKLAEAEQNLVKEGIALVEFAVKQGLFAEARIELAWLKERVADPAVLADAASNIPAAPSYTDIPVYHAKGRAWMDKRDKAHEKAAGKWSDAAGAAKTAAPDRVDAVIDAGLKVFPDHKGLRKLRGQIHVPPFGWLSDKDAALVKKGLVKDGDQWIPRAEAAKRHTSWEDPWIAESEHYQVRCNVSLDDAWMIVRLAEMTHDLFHIAFAGFPEFNQPAGKLVVYYFASIEDATAERKKVHTASPTMPNAAYGYYAFEDAAAHFWVTTKDKSEFERTTRPTIHHELGHQLAGNLLHGALAADPAKKPEFWVTEGMGVYFDEVREDKTGFPSLWNFDGESFRGIFRRGLERSFMPFADFVKLQGAAFYQGAEDDIKNHYGQAGLMVHFFLFGDKGKYREKFMEYAKTVNHGDGRDGLLAEVMGVPLDKLQTEWLAFAKTVAKGGK